MKYGIPILSITGSDASGLGGMQADIKTISELGGHALSAITSVTTQGELGLLHIYDLAREMVMGQIGSIVASAMPEAIKVGLLRDEETIRDLAKVLKGRKNIVCAPGILTSNGQRLASDDACQAFIRYIFPLTDLLVIRCSEAEILLGRKIDTNEDMEEAARELHEMGVKWVMLRGGLVTQSCCTAVLLSEEACRFFSSYNVEGWQKHGVGGALSSAIASELAFGNDMERAIEKAHDYMHSQIVYAVGLDSRHVRPSDFYNQFMSLIAEHYRTAHDVGFYADRLAISTRYLSQMTNKYVGKSPKEVIADYILHEAKILLETSRLTVQEISQRLGFGSQSSFCKFYKKHEGYSPSETRIPSR